MMKDLIVDEVCTCLMKSIAPKLFFTRHHMLSSHVILIMFCLIMQWTRAECRSEGRKSCMQVVRAGLRRVCVRAALLHNHRHIMYNIPCHVILCHTSPCTSRHAVPYLLSLLLAPLMQFRTLHTAMQLLHPMAERNKSLHLGSRHRDTACHTMRC